MVSASESDFEDNDADFCFGDGGVADASGCGCGSRVGSLSLYVVLDSFGGCGSTVEEATEECVTSFSEPESSDDGTERC
jgi:hypothetical protein